MIKTYLLFFCVCVCVLDVRSQLLPGATVAGGNRFGMAANQLFNPDGLFVDAAGNIYIADYDNHRIQKWGPFDLSGSTVAGFGGRGSAANQLHGPSDIQVDAAGNIYIADQFNGRVQKWAPGASVGITVAGGNGIGSAANQFNTAIGIFVDATGNVFVADYYNSRIQKWPPGATSGITVAGGYGQGSAANQFYSVHDVFVDAAGNVYGVDQGLHRIQKWAPGATSGVTVAGGNGQGSGANQLNSPWSMHVDLSGNIYITDRGNHRIQKWAPGASSGTTLVKENPNAPFTELLFLSGIFIDSKENIYVSEIANHKVIRYSQPDATAACIANIFSVAASCRDQVTVHWPEPRDTFPASIDIPAQLDPYNGALTFIGTFDGHGYYRSTHPAMWPVAMDIARFIGGTEAPGHLVTLSSPAEQNFVYNKVKNSGYSPWIGLYNTGKPGVFRWVNDEAVNFTNWSSGEPNNAGGNIKKVREPYVRLMDGSGTWNDQRSDNVPFIAEFDKPLIRYKQVSGPQNGSSLALGVYKVCYERTNLITDLVDSCCFTITVTCKLELTDNDIASSGISKYAPDVISNRLNVVTSPNPSLNFFTLAISSSNNLEKLTVQVSDVSGKILEVRKGVPANQILQIGHNLKPGVYFAQVIQGTRKILVKLVKQER